LWDKYATKEYEGLERFEDALSKNTKFSRDIAVSEEINKLSGLIAETNNKLRMSFKREHTYKLKMHEEQLYKEVMFDPRDRFEHQEEVRMENLMRKVKNPGVIRNFAETHEEGMKFVPFPVHPRLPVKVQNMHEGHTTVGQDQGHVMDPYHYLQTPNNS
jgi:hypothetical protein